MDGKTSLYALRKLLLESSDSGFLDDLTSYDFLYQAACEFASQTKSLLTTTAITTVADQASYDLPADFLELYLKNESGNFYIKYYDGTDNYWLLWRDYEDIIIEDRDDSVDIPDSFCIINDPDLNSQVTGTATSDGASSGGQCTLSDAAASFANVNAGDRVHNTTDTSNGIVISKTSTTALVTALFNGTNNDWTSADAYVIQPQQLMKLVLDPPPSTAAETVTVYYLKRPAPVYSDYGVYPFPIQYHPLLVEYAAWLYKYSDSEPNFGNTWYIHWQNGLKEASRTMNKTLNRKKLTVSFRG
jgi:hypothetical protein